MSIGEAIGFVADVGGTNTRLAFVGPSGVLSETVARRANAAFDSFEHLVLDYLDDRRVHGPMVVAVAGPVGGTQARLTNRNWLIDAARVAASCGATGVTLMNDLEALGQAVPTVQPDAVEPLHAGATLGGGGQGLVIGLGTGFNVSVVHIASGAALISEQGHASLPSSVMDVLRRHMPDTSAFDSIENLFSGVGLLRLAKVIGVEVESAEALAKSDDPRAKEALETCTDAFGQMVRELAYAYFPRAGLYFNGSLAQFLLAPERRARVLAPLRSETGFDGQFARIPAFLFVSHTVALGGAAARLMAQVEAA
ncbi:MAG: glucokinase [Pseudomonadota bacterium]